MRTAVMGSLRQDTVSASRSVSVFERSEFPSPSTEAWRAAVKRLRTSSRQGLRAEPPWPELFVVVGKVWKNTFKITHKNSRQALQRSTGSTQLPGKTRHSQGEGSRAAGGGLRAAEKEGSDDTTTVSAGPRRRADADDCFSGHELTTLEFHHLRCAWARSERTGWSCATCSCSCGVPLRMRTWTRETGGRVLRITHSRRQLFPCPNKRQE